MVASRKAIGHAAAHYRADAEDRELDPAPPPATGPEALEELAEAVEDFDRAWTRLRATIRRTVEGR